MKLKEEFVSEWESCNTKMFWGEIAPCDHVVQIYENDTIFLDALAGFLGSGINAGDCVIVIATSAHLRALDRLLKEHAINVKALISGDQYIPLDAEETLSKFMINGWPDENLFMDVIGTLVARAKKKNRQVRAFGEMVALLWLQGHNGATVQLEKLWNKFCEKEALCLFCAYPKIGFTQDANESLNRICEAHSKIIAGWEKSTTEIHYKNVVQHKAT